ncbi:hypothetical protein Tco_0077302 [Tanacetum coccineum]
MCKNGQSDLVRKRIKRIMKLRKQKERFRIYLKTERVILTGLSLMLVQLKVNAARHNLLLLLKVNAARRKFTTIVESENCQWEVQLQALVDGKKIIVTKASIRCDLQLNDEEGTDCLPNATIFEELTRMRIYVTPSHTEKIFGNMRRVGKGFSGRDTPLFPTMMVQAQQKQGEGSVISRRPKRKDTEVPQPSGPTDNVADEAVYEEMTAQAQEITSLKLRVKRLKNKGGSRTYGLKRLYKVGRSAKVISSNEASLGDQEDASKQGRIADIDADTESIRRIQDMESI